MFCADNKNIYFTSRSLCHWDVEWCEEFQRQRLQSLAQKLPTVVMQSREGVAMKQYRYGFQRWKAWAQSIDGFVCFPANPMHVALYSISFMQGAKSSSPVCMFFYSISWLTK